MSTKDGGPAFPTFDAIACCDVGGMTLRDYFAAKAMQGLIAEPEWRGAPPAIRTFTKDLDTPDINEIDRYASAAYRLADAMLRARA